MTTVLAFGAGVVVGTLYHPFFKPLVLGAWKRIKEFGNGNS